MQSVKQETISGFNGYLDGLEKQKDLLVTVVQFDSIGIDTLCDAVTLDKATRLNESNYSPRASTPLYDAVGKTIQQTRGDAKDCKVMFVVLTDGHENASHEFSDSSVKALIKECENRDHWTFAFIGMGIGGWASMQAMAAGTLSSSNVLNVDHDAKGTGKAYRSLARASVSYCSAKGGQTVGGLFAGQDADDTQ